MHIAERGRFPICHHFGNSESQTPVKLFIMVIMISMFVGLQRVVFDFVSTRFSVYKWSVFSIGSVTKRGPDGGFFVVAAVI